MAEYFEDFKLKVFLAVARLGSFTVAARELGVSQPAVSQNITSLEKSLGVQLLERRRGDVFLTDAGRSFLQYARKINYWYDAADRMFGQQGLATGGKPVRIAADAVCADYVLPTALSALASSHPELAFDVLPFGRQADVQLSAAPTPQTMDFEGEALLVGVIDAAVVASPVNRGMQPAAVASEDGHLPFSTIAGVHVSNRFAVWDRYQKLLAPDLQSRVAVSSSSLELIKSLVASSDKLVGILPEPAVTADIAAGRLLRLPVRLPEFGGRTVCHLLKESLRDSK